MSDLLILCQTVFISFCIILVSIMIGTHRTVVVNLVCRIMGTHLPFETLVYHELLILSSCMHIFLSLVMFILISITSVSLELIVIYIASESVIIYVPMRSSQMVIFMYVDFWMSLLQFLIFAFTSHSFNSTKISCAYFHFVFYSNSLYKSLPQDWGTLSTGTLMNK